MSGNGQKNTPRPVPVARASMVWDDIAPRERTGPVLPASSVRARIFVERERVGHGAHLEVRPAVTAAGAGLVAGALLAGTPSTVGRIVVAVLGALLGVAVTVVWSTVTGGPVVRQLCQQVRRERPVAASLAPLESAGWVVLHDRLVAAHRVPHVLVGPAGVGPGLRLPGRVVVALPGPPYRGPAAQRRRPGPRRAAGGVASAGSSPAVRGHADQAPHPRRGHHPHRGVGPKRARDATGAPTRARRWTVTVSSVYVLLNRPADRAPEPGTGVGFSDLGEPMRTYMETALPAGLTHDAAAFLAVVVDDACPPA